MKRAFTLIELLVVIAIIAILAAILFPVFAQAKASAKATAAISNMKQIGTGMKMYLADNDDVYPLRKYAVQTPNGNARYGFSWKNMIFPYVKNMDIFRDGVNEASRFPDDSSDPQLAAREGLVVPPQGTPRFARGYAYADLPWLHQKSWSANTISDTALENPAGTLLLAEHKRVWVDTGPYLNWDRNAEYPGDPTAGFRYPWGGGKWDDKAMVLVFFDSHAKRVAHSRICGRDDEMNMWGYQRNQLGAWGGLGEVNWVDTYCQTMPQAVK